MASVPRQRDGASATAGATSLDRGTKLDHRPAEAILRKGFCDPEGNYHHSPIPAAPPPGVRMNIYPGVGEAVIFVVPGPSSRARNSDEAPEPDKEESARKAAQRAQTKVRRYCLENRIDKLWTFTYADEATTRAQVMRDGATFARKLRKRFGPMPYVLVVERGKEGRLHLHMGFGRWLPKEAVDELWGKGWVWAKRLGPDNQAAKRCANYLSKYVGKAFAEAEAIQRLEGEHRYEVGQGFQPVPVEAEGHSVGEMIEVAVALMGGDPSSAWSSTSVEDWRGPPVWVLCWDEVTCDGV